MTQPSPTDLLWQSFLHELVMERFQSPAEQRARDEAAAAARRRKELAEATEPTSLRLIADNERAAS